MTPAKEESRYARLLEVANQRLAEDALRNQRAFFTAALFAFVMTLAFIICLTLWLNERAKHLHVLSSGLPAISTVGRHSGAAFSSAASFSESSAARIEAANGRITHQQHWHWHDRREAREEPSLETVLLIRRISGEVVVSESAVPREIAC